MNPLWASRRIVATSASVPLAALATVFGAAWFAVSGAGQVVSRPASKSGGGSMY